MEIRNNPNTLDTKIYTLRSKEDNSILELCVGGILGGSLYYNKLMVLFKTVEKDVDDLTGEEFYALISENGDAVVILREDEWELVSERMAFGKREV